MNSRTTWTVLNLIFSRFCSQKNMNQNQDQWWPVSLCWAVNCSKMVVTSLVILLRGGESQYWQGAWAAGWFEHELSDIMIYICSDFNHPRAAFQSAQFALLWVTHSQYNPCVFCCCSWNPGIEISVCPIPRVQLLPVSKKVWAWIWN